MYPIISESEKIIMTETLFIMRDGVGIYTRIVHPKSKKRCPIVFIRTPYEQSHQGKAHNIEAYLNDLYIQHGYAVVLQHCRGTGDSEGICTPYVERDDGLDSLSEIRKLPIYNGEIYLQGKSYLSTVHLCYLNENPDDIKAAVLPIQTDRMYFRNFRNGCNYDLCNLRWWLKMLQRRYPNAVSENPVRRPYRDVIKRIVGEDVPEYTDCLMNDKYNDFWKNDPRTGVVETLRIPTLLVEGWYDFYIDGMFSMWERLPEDTKRRSALIVGPWGHATSVSKQAEYPMLDHGNIPNDFYVEWFDSIREQKPYKYAKEGKVSYYSIGADEWRSSEYPSEGKAVKRLYLDECGKLTEKAPEGKGSISYLYDPDECYEAFRFGNIYKASAPNQKEGVISFLTEPLSMPFDIFGKISWNMTVSSDCADTQFFMRVYMVEDGEAYNLTETITSLSYINDDYKPYERLSFRIETPPIAASFKKGTRIRVDISSDGGIYMPHANVRGHFAEVKFCRIANNTLHFGDSYIELPIR